jgi:hypothetical protein
MALIFSPSTLYLPNIIVPVQAHYLNCNITLIRRTCGQNLSTTGVVLCQILVEQCTESLFNLLTPEFYI